MTDRPRRILVTGASGFIGRHCLRRLLAATQDDRGIEIHAVARRGGAEEFPTVRWHVADLRDPARAIGLIAEIQPTHLLNLAWIATPGIYADAPENLDWLEAGLALLHAFGEWGGQRFVGIGTSYEYAESAEPCREDATPTGPVTLYGKCKLAMGIAAGAAAQRHGFEAAWGRLFVPYGPGDTPARLIPSLAAALAAGHTIKTSSGTQLRDFIFAPDAADLLVRLLESGATGPFNLASGQAVSVRTVIEKVASRFADPGLVRFGDAAIRPGEPAALVADMGKVRAALGWQAPTALDAGLDLTLAALDKA